MQQRGRAGLLAQAFLTLLVLSQASGFIQTVSRSIHDSVSHKKNQQISSPPLSSPKIPEENHLGSHHARAYSRGLQGDPLPRSPAWPTAQSRVASDCQDVRTATTWPPREGLRPRP
jgi:hypothetical protein